jgi:hypothetical protein
MLCHLTAHAVGGLTPFATFEGAAFAWRRLRRAFPQALAVVLLPNHLHIVSDEPDPDAARRRLAAVLSGVARHPPCATGSRVWAEVPPPRPIPDVRHLARHVRYLALNPCRSGLVRDPLSWLWSTHRDVIGAVADPWASAERLAAALRRPRRGFEAAHHAYVSGDPSTCVTGTPFPQPVAATDSPSLPLETIRLATAAALRVPLDAVRRRTTARRLFVQLAWHQGWRNTRLLARECQATRQAIRGLLRQPDPGLTAARLCLADARLRHGPFPAETHARAARAEAVGVDGPVAARFQLTSGADQAGP